MPLWEMNQQVMSWEKSLRLRALNDYAMIICYQWKYDIFAEMFIKFDPEKSNYKKSCVKDEETIPYI